MVRLIRRLAGASVIIRSYLWPALFPARLDAAALHVKLPIQAVHFDVLLDRAWRPVTDALTGGDAFAQVG